MDSNQLQNFIAVVDAGSFQKAAKLKFLTQRAISISMAQLEAELGFKLFLRGKNKIVVTQAGQQFYAHVRDMMQNLGSTIEILKTNQQAEYQELNIGYFSPFDGLLLAQHLNATQLKGKVKINVSEESVENLISDVVLGVLDGAYVMDYHSQNSYLKHPLQTTTIFNNQIMIGISRQNPLSQMPFLDVEILSQYPLLYYAPEDSNYIKNGFVSHLHLELKQLDIRRAPSIEHMQLLVAANQAIAHYAGGLIDLPLNQRVAYLPLDGVDTSYSIQFIYQKQGPKADLIKKYLSVIQQ
ncbi:LysR family transcriptional regulator [Lactobacillus xylocopicola]|uniref:LysR family transcriptional regulator n=1 Tax=Lactobacillus xylocopicola TaxID=2976676 RepID=A0ABN6SLU8_9LACO|nr:LysR family transcriptional regulator [Lactobacillus xylocopicola]BDR59892.1 LysR family transcriptional regulator [Lactobacillus xylocopicola]